MNEKECSETDPMDIESWDCFHCDDYDRCHKNIKHNKSGCTPLILIPLLFIFILLILG